MNTGLAPTRRGAMLAAMSAGTLALTGCSRSGGRVLRSTDIHPDGYPTVEAVREMGRLLEARSNGRLKLKLYSGGQLGEEKDALEITIFGGLDLTRVSLAPLNSIAPETAVLMLPFLFESVAHMHRAVDGAPGQKILSLLEPHGLIGLCYYDSGARSFYTTDRIVRTPDDLKGQKIRVPNSDMLVAMVEALGGDATPMPLSEVYQALLQGVVDGAENNWPSYESSRHFEAARFCSLTQHVMAPEVLVMSAQRWRALPAADQALIRDCARESVPIMRALWAERELKSQDVLREAGVEIFEPQDLAPFQQKVRPVWEKFIATPEMDALVKEIQDLGER
jgi:tripartite ATP-independent transporter DctP family solute receptor